MEKEDILRTLQELGLGEWEAKVYVALVSLGVTKAGPLSRRSEVPQSKIYIVLENLVDRQMVEVLDGRPREFHAVHPKRAFQILLESHEQKLDGMRAKMKELANILKPASETTGVISGIWNIKGEKWAEFFERAADMVRRSNKYVFGVTREFSQSSVLIEAMDQAIKRGVKSMVIGLSGANAENLMRIKWYRKHLIDIKVFETALHPRLIVVDGKEVLMRFDHDPRKKEGFKFNSVWSQDPSLVNVFDIYMKNLWKVAKPLDLARVESEIVEKSGVGNS